MPEKSGPAAEKSATTLPGTVQKIIHSPDPGIPEKAEIAVEGADDLYKEIRIENTLTDEKGNEVKLKPGAEVEVTVEAPPEATEPKKDEAQGKERPATMQNHKAKGNGK
ncbi:MAG TPA: hypothetical protein VN780_12825 [Candidatus Eisenbacteria bacterium]|jgi:hypothetical protein|nr:hypothetical protein [Candidatus Eisenbacteria bacterium]